ncbi:hypothetical protein WMY93_017256 [Mugilogobius chulae]|uniref:Ig-like domain-containing protein n=1 Tax=Mugilogobius chulae TaxID=88201 RepID=A0AAW0NS16_9GOBI
MTKEDVGTYYCGIVNPDDVLFGSGTVLELEGDSKPVQTELSPDYISMQPGDSVTLTCSFNTSFCSEQTSVTWIKSGWTTEIIAQSSGIKNIVCGNTDGTSCVHNLTLKDVSSAEDGTYFCLASACGHSLTGTRIHVNGGGALSERSDFSPTVLILIVLNVVFAAAVVVLVWVVYSNRKNQQTEVDGSGSPHGEQTDDEVTYAGVNVVPRSATNRTSSSLLQFKTMISWMSVSALLLWTLCASQLHSVQQKECFKMAKVGETVEMKCQTESVWRIECGTVLELEGDSKPVQTELQSPDYIRVQPGDSVTLTCSFNTSFCSEQTTQSLRALLLRTNHSIAQSSGIKNIVCGNTDGTSCVHNLTLKDVSSAEDGTYFCVVSACGHSLTGTRIQVNGLVVTSEPDSFYSNGIALIVSNNLAVLVVFVLLFGLWRASTKAGKCHDRRSTHNQPDDTLTYTTESLVTLSKSTTINRRRDPDIYTQVWYSHCTVLELEGDSKPVQTELSPDYIRVQPGDSVTLTCSFNTSFCSEQTSVTWIKSDVSSAENGTYFCVVSACGHSLTGTRIHVNGDKQSSPGPIVLVLTLLNVVFFAAVVALLWVVYSYKKDQQTEVDFTDSTCDEQAEDDVTYAGVNVVPRSASNRSTSSTTPRHDEVVYSQVKNRLNEPSN